MLNFPCLIKYSLSGAVSFLMVAPVAIAYESEDYQRVLATKSCEGCDLSGADLSFLNLAGADLRGANLQGADLSSTNLTNANLEGTDLTGAILTNTVLTDANLDEAIGFAEELSTQDGSDSLSTPPPAAPPAASGVSPSSPAPNNASPASGGGAVGDSSQLPAPTAQRGAVSSEATESPRRCQDLTDQDLPIAIAPPSNVALAASQPVTLYWYLPEISASHIEFVLDDGSDSDDTLDIIYDAQFRVPEREGIISLTLNNTLLEPGQSYRWQLTVVCDSENGDNTVIFSTDGWLRIVELLTDIQDQLEQTSSLVEKISIYLDEGIWQDGLSNLMRLKEASSEDEQSEEAWQDIISRVGFQDLVDIPLLGELAFLQLENEQPNSDRQHRGDKPSRPGGGAGFPDMIRPPNRTGGAGTR